MSDYLDSLKEHIHRKRTFLENTTSVNKSTTNSQTSVVGTDNTVPNSSNLVDIAGNNNLLGDNVSNITIRGNNNTIPGGLSNVAIINTSNVTATYSNETWVNGLHITYSGIVINENINYIEAGKDVVIDPFGVTIINFVDAGIDNILNLGGSNLINFVEGNIL
jgi:hypothetical protein